MSTEPCNTNNSTLAEHAVAADSIGNECAKRILALLKAGEEKINFESNPDVVLIIGNTGAGKTTFTQFIAGDNDRATSTEVGEYTGEFIISDYDNKISANSTIISKTTFPELIIDSETKTAYIDNPGFNDSRNEAYDVAAAYFIKKVFDTVKNVKIILLTNYPSVRKGVNRNDFLSLLEHVTVLLKNIDRFTDSIALVVTKVDNTLVMYDGHPVLISDSAVINNIASFLIEVKESLQTMLNDGETYVSQSKRVEGNIFCKSAIKLLDALLTKNDSRYARLSLFRRPNKSGKLSQIKLLQDCKRIIKNMVAQNLQYRPTKNTEIGYAISDKSKNVIRDLVTEINENIVANVAFINTDLITYFRNLEREMLSDSMYTLRDRLASASKVLSCITNIGELASAADFVTIMCKHFTDIEVAVRKSSLRNIANLGKFLIFLQKISPMEFKTFVWTWTKELNEALRYVDDSMKWYNILVSLYGRLSEYEVQKNRSSYRIPTFPTLPSEGMYLKDMPDLLAFLDAVGGKSFCETIHFKAMQEIRLDDMKIRFFDHLVQTTLSNTLVYTSFDGGQRVQVAGEYILLSEVLAHNLYKSCDSLQIFARLTVFLDAALHKDNDISIIAPRWEIIGEPMINLDGSAAQPLPRIEANEAKLKSPLPAGTRGVNGKPGLPGASAGHFLGIGSVFKNIVNLRISANGGCGGAGQDGGNGTPGENGKSFSIWPYRSYRETYVEKNRQTLYTVPGGRGGDSGCGGDGGIGGHKGELIIIDMSKSNSFTNCSIITNPGDYGKPGIPGKPGDGGKSGTTIQIVTTEVSYPDYPNAVPRTCDFYASDYTQFVGVAGYINNAVCTNGRQPPKTKEFRRQPALVISDYTFELLKNIHKSIKKHVLLRFYEEIHHNDQLHEYYDAKILSNELQCLEVHHNQFTVDTTVILYRSILEKILRVAKSRPNEHTQLEFLRLAVTSKLLRLQAKPNIYKILILEPFSPFEIMSGDSDMKFVFNVLDLLVKNNLDPATERIDSQIIELSYPHSEQASDDIHDLGALLLKRKLFGDLKILSQFLHLLCILANLDHQIIKEMSILKILPLLKFKWRAESAIKRKLENAIYKFQLNTVHVVEALASLMLIECKSYQRSVEPKPNIISCLQAIEEELQSTTYSCAKSFSTEKAVTNLKESLEKLRSLVSDENTAYNTNSDEAEMIKRIEIRRKLIQFDTQIYNKVNRESNIERIAEALDSVENVAQKLDGIVSLIVPVIKTINLNVTLEYDPVKILLMRKTVFDFMDTQIVFLHDIKKQFDIDEELLPVIENLVEIMKVLRSIYGTVASTEPRSRLWKYSQWIGKKKGFEKLDEFISRDFLLYEHQHFVNVYNRLVFPYNILNPDKFTAPSVPENVDLSIADLRKSLEGTRETLKITLDILLKNPPTEYTTEDHFDATTNQGPLYEWKYASYAKNITDLLRGKQVALTATVDPKDQRQFLRFASIRLRFQTLNENIQVSLNDALRNFSIRMVHSGSSSFAFCNQTHLINEEHSEYDHTADTDAKTEQLKSPYTLWLFSLHPTQENATFHTLRPFVDQPVNLQLEGRVKYLKIEDEAAFRQKFEITTMNADYSMLMPPSLKHNDSTPSTFPTC